MERYMLSGVFGGRNKTGKNDEFLYFSGEKVYLNRREKSCQVILAHSRKRGKIPLPSLLL